eukprot:CAMPEP_0173256852 /NCGR_PEP_ID=MMETSP1142-20121109/23415_1 /TAXON_ID=483371 /ORGANISM="non described non described, Strain CCMP2298" /LENGTH=122 /DNA_ID=CAMNT_0014190857 /DNA_START=230 /DNA_END=598 /DNA_ORIENTATION=-
MLYCARSSSILSVCSLNTSLARDAAVVRTGGSAWALLARPGRARIGKWGLLELLELLELLGRLRGGARYGGFVRLAISAPHDCMYGLSRAAPPGTDPLLAFLAGSAGPEEESEPCLSRPADM